MIASDGPRRLRTGRPQEAAETYLRTAQAAPSTLEKAKAYAMAGTLFGLAGNAPAQETSTREAATLWLAMAGTAFLVTEQVDAYWEAFLQFVALQDSNAQLQRRAKRLNHVNSSFLAREEDTRNAETTLEHPEP